MKKILIIAPLLTITDAAASSFDDPVLWLRELGISQAGIGADPGSICLADFEIYAAYTNPYQIGRLRWNDLFLKKGFESWGIHGRFNSYRLEEYYNRYGYELGSAFRAIDSLVLLAALRHEEENYAGFGSFEKREMDARFAYRRFGLSIGAGLSGIVLSEDHDTGNSGRVRAWGSCSYEFSRAISLTASVRRFSNGTTRWLFGQDLRVSEELNLTIGYMNRPDLIFGKLIVSHGSYLFEFTYYSVSSLNDTVIVGIGYKR